MIYYWIVSQHSGKALDVQYSSTDNGARIIQYTKKSEGSPNVDSQLWYFDGGIIINKNSGHRLDVAAAKFQDGTLIIQHYKWKEEPASAQEWDYNYEDNTINLRFDQNFVLDVKDGSQNDSAQIILHKKNGLPNQKFILQKWNDVSSASAKSLVANIIDHNKFLPKLSQNLLETLDDDEYYVINIEVGNDPYIKIFHAHTNILYYRSPYFRRILSTNKKKNDGTLSHIKLSNILPETFQIILRYIYGGRLSLKEYDTSDIIKILVATNELGLQELVDYLQSYLIKNKTNCVEQNFNLVYQTSFENDSFLELQKYCTDLVTNDPDKIFKSLNFSSISEKLLISLIQSDNLQINDIQIWEYVIKWGIAQNPELSSDISSYSNDDFNSLRNTLQKCIPFIKFFNLTSREFLNKVYPYKKILSEELYENLIKHFLDRDEQNNKSNNSQKIIKEINLKSFDSRIITYQHVELISKWVNKLVEETSPYEFRLLFRGSRDGFYPENFHEICDKKSRTITIVKVKGSKEILGGYNPIEWKSGDTWDTTNDSFVFSFKNNDHDNINNYILSRIKNKNNAVYNGSYCGPSFGGGDLIIWGFDFNNYCSCSKTSYEKLIRETEDRFSIEECEVFRLMFKFSKE